MPDENETRKEWLDRAHLRFMDHVVAVSEAQAVKVRRAGVKPASMARSSPRRVRRASTF